MSKIFEIPEKKLSRLMTRANTIATRAKRYGLPIPQVKLLDMRPETKEVFDPLAKVRGHENGNRQIGFMLARIEVEGCEPRVGDWNIVGYRYQTRDRENNLRGYNSGFVPEGKHNTPLCCEHCQTSRKRSQTLIVCDEAGERFVEVGSSCLGDFTGHSFNEGFLNSVRDAGSLLAEVEAASKWSLDDPDLDLEEEVRSVLAIASSIVREEGFISSREAEEKGVSSTSQAVADEMHRLNNPDVDQSTVMVLGSDFELADQIIEYFKNQQDQPGFVMAVKTCLNRGLAGPRDIGLLAAASGSYFREMDRNKQRDVAKDVVDKSRELGEVNKSMTFTGTVRSARYIRNSDFWVVSIVDRNDNLLVWLTSSEHGLTEGHRYEFKASVKGHSRERYGAYQGATATQIKRVTVKERFGPEVAAPAPMESKSVADELDMVFGL